MSLPREIFQNIFEFLSYEESLGLLLTSKLFNETVVDAQSNVLKGCDVELYVDNPELFKITSLNEKILRGVKSIDIHTANCHLSDGLSRFITRCGMGVSGFSCDEYEDMNMRDAIQIYKACENLNNKNNDVADVLWTVDQYMRHRRDLQTIYMREYIKPIRLGMILLFAALILFVKSQGRELWSYTAEYILAAIMLFLAIFKLLTSFVIGIINIKYLNRITSPIIMFSVFGFVIVEVSCLFA